MHDERDISRVALEKGSKQVCLEVERRGTWRTSRRGRSRCSTVRHDEQNLFNRSIEGLVVEYVELLSRLVVSVSRGKFLVYGQRVKRDVGVAERA
jgi:hypothetical protein